MSILNKNSDRYDALGIYPRVLFDMTKFEEYKYVTKGDDWDCVINKNQFIYELNTCTYEESRIISAYLDLNGWYHHKIKFDDRILRINLADLGPWINIVLDIGTGFILVMKLVLRSFYG